jgi:hypothetical protein
MRIFGTGVGLFALAMTTFFLAGGVQGQKASPSLTTTPSPTPPVLGDASVTLSDSATLSNGANPTGIITFDLFDPNGNLRAQDIVPVNNGNATYNSFNVPLDTMSDVTGAWHWDAMYGGDPTNNSADSDPEVFTINAATPTLVTTPGGTVILGGSGTLTDSATLSGGYFPTGQITFNLLDPNGNLVAMFVDPVNGNGTYTTPAGVTPLTAGLYEWHVDYGSGNLNNEDIPPDTLSPECEAVISATSSRLCPTGGGGGGTVPEPSSLLLIGPGLAGLGFARRRKLK